MASGAMRAGSIPAGGTITIRNLRGTMKITKTNKFVKSKTARRNGILKSSIASCKIEGFHISKKEAAELGKVVESFLRK